MTFSQFAFKNVVRNKRLYAAYFLSSMFTVMTFFTFAIFAFHPELSAEAMGSKVNKGMLVAGGIIYVFSFFFVLYSMSTFLKSRKKEFGLLMIQGMSSGQLRMMVFIENMVIGLASIILGIGLGLVFAKFILLIAENVLVIEQSLVFYFPLAAIVVTLVSFLILFLAISLFVAFVLRTNKLIELIKGDQIEKKEPRASVFLVVLASLFLAVGYYLALSAEGAAVVIVFIPVTLLVIFGSYLLFTQISVYVIRRIKANKKLFWKGTNMLLFSDLSYRMKDNARSFFIVAIISTVAFTAIGTLVGMRTYLTEGIHQANPIDFTYRASDEKTKAEDLKLIQAALDKHQVKTEADSFSFSQFDVEELDRLVHIVSDKDYNRFAKLADADRLEVAEGKAYVVRSSITYITNESLEASYLSYEIPLTNQRSLEATELIDSEVLPAFDSYYVVSEKDFDQIDLREPEEAIEEYAWKAVSGTKEDRIAVGETLAEIEDRFIPFMAIDYEEYNILKFYGPILFVGLFIGLIFFVSAGSFLYFRLYADLEDDQKKFKAINKIGLTEKELSKVVTRQTALLFFTPIMLALVHGSVALTALAHMFNYDLFNESALVLGSFLMIQIVYFLIVRHFYLKQIKAVL